MKTTNDVEVGFEELARGCGCVGRFVHYEVDPYRKERREQFQRKRCPACGRKANDLHNQKMRAERPSGRIKKGSEPRHLPAGAVVMLVRLDDGSWSGVLEAGGLRVEKTSNGVMGIVSDLARRWLSSAGKKLAGKVT